MLDEKSKVTKFKIITEQNMGLVILDSTCGCIYNNQPSHWCEKCWTKNRRWQSLQVILIVKMNGCGQL